jgi:hypothetical protein
MPEQHCHDTPGKPGLLRSLNELAAGVVCLVLGAVIVAGVIGLSCGVLVRAYHFAAGE